MSLQPGDIVNREGGPAEVLASFPTIKPRPLVFIMNKRTLVGEFVDVDAVTFVRRPEKVRPK